MHKEKTPAPNSLMPVCVRACVQLYIIIYLLLPRPVRARGVLHNSSGRLLARRALLIKLFSAARVCSLSGTYSLG